MADAWVIRTGATSPASRFKPPLQSSRRRAERVIVGTEANSEAGFAIHGGEEDIGWVVPPEDPARLGQAICEAAADRKATLERGRVAAGCRAEIQRTKPRRFAIGTSCDACARTKARTRSS